jgi:hypothetical protein
MQESDPQLDAAQPSVMSAFRRFGVVAKKRSGHYPPTARMINTKNQRPTGDTRSRLSPFRSVDGDQRCRFPRSLNRARCR